MICVHKTAFLRHFLLVLLSCILPSVHAELQEKTDSPALVGSVSFVVGSGHVIRQQLLTPIVKGTAFQVGDLIQTGSNGHVHILFIDGQRVSVRPNSKFQIEAYQHDAKNRQNSIVKFDLKEGAVRSVTGSVPKDRFRLNTPLVAVGVRGTDFTIMSSAKQTQLIVHQGTVVMAPFDAQCSASGVGACGSSQRAKVLDAAMVGTSLIYRSDWQEPLLQNIKSSRQSDVTNIAAGRGESGQQATTAIVADTAAPATSLSGLVVKDSMVWGRWGRVVMPGDTLTQPLTEAMEGRSVTVGEGYYFLFRNESGVNFVPYERGSYNFSLKAGSAYYNNLANEKSAASVSSGSLGINFANSTFTTNLTVHSPITGSVELDASGRIDRSTGIFVGNGVGSKVAGSVSYDINQAGYFFTKSLSSGSLSGATLWSK